MLPVCYMERGPLLSAVQAQLHWLWAHQIIEGHSAQSILSQQGWAALGQGEEGVVHCGLACVRASKAVPDAFFTSSARLPAFSPCLPRKFCTSDTPPCRVTASTCCPLLLDLFCRGCDLALTYSCSYLQCAIVKGYIQGEVNCQIYIRATHF